MARSTTAYDVPHTTVHTGVISGGTQLNIVPGHCHFEFEFRHLPADDPQAMLSEVKDYHPEACRTFDAGHRSRQRASPGSRKSSFPGLEVNPDEEVVSLAKGLTGSNDTGKVAFGTEAGLFQKSGIPAVVCGPGSIEQAHKPDEYVSLEQLALCEGLHGAPASAGCEGVSPMAPPNTVIFDIGGVLIDWNPRHLYRKLIADEAERERFLTEVCSQSWNEQADAGRPTAEITAELVQAHPHRADLIEAYYGRFDEMMAGAIEGTVQILSALRARGTRLYALSNFARETFPLARRRFEFLSWFEGIVVSAEEGVKKPDPRIFEILFERHGIEPGDALFIDDLEKNIAAAEATGLSGHRFISPAALEKDLIGRGLLPGP